MGCSSSTARLFVDLRSDYEPGTEIAQVVVRLEIEEGLERVESFDVDASTDLLSGVRVARFEDLAQNRSYRLHLDATGPDGNLVETRLGIVTVRDDTAVTIVISRICGERECPGPASAPDATECVGGTCVPPGCFPETPELCGETCEDNVECSGENECGVGVCVDSICQLAGDASLCASGECRPDFVCEPMAPMPSCTNGVQDGTETGVDCGGECLGCGPGGISDEGLLQWYDFSDADSLFSDQTGTTPTEPGGSIGLVRDKGPLGLDMVSGGLGTSPRYVSVSRPNYAEFDGRDDRLSVTFPAAEVNLRDASLFIIYRIDRRQHDEMLLQYTGNDDSDDRDGAIRVSGIDNATSNRLRSYFVDRDADGGTLFNSWFVNDGTDRLLEFNIESSPARIRAYDFDRELFDDPSTAYDHTPGRFVLGSRYDDGYSDELECRVYEYIAYARTLSGAERALLVTYLNAKYAFAL